LSLVPALERRDIGLLPGGLLLVVFGAWAANGGGFRTTAWYPGGLLVLGVLGVVLIALGDRLVITQRASVPIALLCCFTAWSYLSIAWADVPATAWDGANRTAVYLAVFVLLCAFEWRAQAVMIWLGLFVLTVTIVATIDLVAALRAAHPGSHFTAGRFTGPIEYQNGSAGLFLMAAWPAVVLAAQRVVPWAIRALCAAAAAYLVELTLLTQSRGAVLGAAVTAVIFLVVVPTRVRAVVAASAVGLAVVLASDPILDVYRVVIARGDTHAALVDAAHAILWSCVIVLVVASAATFLDGRWTVPVRRARLAGRIIGSVLVLAAAVVVAGAAATTDVRGRAHRAWHEFTGIPKPYGVGLGNPSSHFEADPLSGNRYDVWRVAWHQFKRSPANGAGADNFAVDYLRERRSDEEPQYPFSIELRALGQTGFVGALLLAGFLAACAVTLIRPRRPSPRAVAAACTTLVATQWLAHGSVDIFWELPALGAPAFAALALGVRVADAGAAEAAPGRARSLRWLLVGGGGLLVVACMASFVFPWLAAANVRAAEGTWRSDPSAAAAKLERARSLNPLSDDADIVRGVIAGRRRDWSGMRAAFVRARARNRLNWYSWFELAVVDAYTHRGARALGELREAERLDPREWTIGFVRYRLRIGKPLAPIQLDRIFRIRYVARTAPAPPSRP
jgi:hypothetical protein